MADIDPAEVAAGLMLDAARNVTELQVRNELGDLVGIDDLTDQEHEAMVAQVLDLIRTADIDIDTA